MQSETIELGGHINLTGFSEVDKGKMVVLKKIIGNYARKFSDRSSKFGELDLTLKEESEAFTVTAKLVDDTKETSEVATEKNIFVAVDNALKKIE